MPSLVDLTKALFYFLFGCQKQRGSDLLVHHPKTSMPRGKKTRKEKVGQGFQSSGENKIKRQPWSRILENLEPIVGSTAIQRGTVHEAAIVPYQSSKNRTESQII